MKIKLTAGAFSNCTYKREEIVDSEYSEDEWSVMTTDEQEKYLEELTSEFVWDDIDANAEVVEEGK